MTTNELAAKVAKIAKDIEISMTLFPKLGPKHQTAVSIAGDILVERLHEAWAEFVAQQWKERAQ